ncbi:unnamed protein product [Knipowitschia caucasica]
MKEGDGLRFRRQTPRVITEEPRDQDPRRDRSYSGRVFQITFLSVGGVLLVPVLILVLVLESPIHPEPFILREPLPFEGCWAPNLKLRLAERLHENQVQGPESIVNIGDVLYSGTADGRIVKMVGHRVQTVARLGKQPCGSRDDEPTCGRPLGIRVGPNGTLFVADAYLGIYRVNPITGEVVQLVDGAQLVGGRSLAFINDLDVTRDGRKVFFTCSSSRWQRRDFLHLVMEATEDGRVLELDTDTGEVTVVMDRLRFPNGLQLLPDEESVLVSETTMARIRRIHVAGLNKGGMETFAENLPGFPDNIRRSSSGGLWVAMSSVRPSPGFSMLDFLSQRPWIKKLIFKVLSQDLVLKLVPRYSLIAEIQNGGRCVRSFHDPNGEVAAYVSEAHEHEGHLYIGSFRSPYVSKLDLSRV